MALAPGNIKEITFLDSSWTLFCIFASVEVLASPSIVIML